MLKLLLHTLVTRLVVPLTPKCTSLDGARPVPCPRPDARVLLELELEQGLGQEPAEGPAIQVVPVGVLVAVQTPVASPRLRRGTTLTPSCGTASSASNTSSKR